MIDFAGIFSMSGQAIAFRLVAGLVLVVVHGVTLAWLARMLGDPGPVHDGRLSLNPLAHLHPLGLVSLIVARLGWMRPIDTGAATLRGGLVGVLALVVVSLAMLPVFGALIWQVRPHLLAMFPGSNPAILAIGIIETTARLSIWFALVNLVPLPPFTAGLLLTGLAPAAHRLMMRHLTAITLVLLLIALGGSVTPLIAPAAATLESLLLR